MALSELDSISAQGSSTSPSVTLGSSPANGDLVVVAISADEKAGNVTITAPSGYTIWPTDGAVQNSGNVRLASYYKVAGVAESATITGTISGSTTWAMAAMVLHDSLGGTWSLDKSAHSTGSTDSPTTGTTATTTHANEALCAAIGTRNTANFSSPTNSFTVLETETAATSLAILFRVVTSTGAYSTGAHLSASRQYSANIATFYTNAPAPTNSVAPVVSGTTEVESTLSCTTGTWTSSPDSYSYQWQRDNEGGGSYSSISGATSSTYLLVDADDACNIRCQVSATNTGGTGGPVASNAVGPVDEPAPVNTVLPEIAGSATRTLAVSDGLWSHMAGSVRSFTRDWELSADGVSGWSSTSGDEEHTISDLEIGQYLRATVTATNTGGSTAETSAVFGPLIETTLSYVVEMAFGSGPGTESPVWTDISDYVRTLNWNRGRQNELSQMAAGTGSMTLRDEDSHFDPRNPDSPFYPDVRPGTPVRAYITVGYGTIPLFVMTTERQPRTMRVTDVYTERQIDMVDSFAILANAGISGESFGTEATDVRVNNVLDAVSWPDSRRLIGNGASTLQSISFDDDAGVSALQHLLNVGDSENGLLFADGNGDIVFVGRHELIQQAGYTTSAATFGDAANVG